jgi:spore photoproduct lyase
VIEFRTKSTNVQNLLLLKDHPKNMIPSWTLSPERVVNAIEHKTPSFRERLDAARRCQDAGYEVGVRLDPIIIYEGWEEELGWSKILVKLDPEGIDYVSLGSIKLHKLLLMP